MTDNLPWIEKYRPKRISDVIQQDKIIQMLTSSLNQNDLPHLLLHGPSGTGKTSTILALGRELYGPELFHKRVIELNASDDRGINAVRQKIKDFAKTAIQPRPEGYPYPCPPYKIIVLDEADSMTIDAQSALRKTMEDHSSVTRFCFICNYISRIIEPISSRCAKFQFQALGNELMAGKLRNIIEQEEIDCPDDVLDTIVEIAQGDMRKGIMGLQNVKYLENLDGPITVSKIMEIHGRMPPNRVKRLIRTCRKGTFEEVIEATDWCIRNSYPIDTLLDQLQAEIVRTSKISDLQKAKICLHFGSNQKMVLDGADEYLQLLDMLAYVHMVMHDE